MAVAQLIASRTIGGRVAVQGFYDTVRDRAEPQETGELQRGPVRCKRVHGAACGSSSGLWNGEPGYTPFERMTVRPTFEVNGMWGGFLGEGSKTVIPREAYVKITCRLVAGQDPRVVRLLTAHFQRLCPPYARVEATPGHGARPWKADLEHPALQAAIRAWKDLWKGRGPRGRWGSIPAGQSFDRLLPPSRASSWALPTLTAMPTRLNERFSVETFRVAREAVALFWQEAARDGLKS